ncbi:pilus assembly protein TadG-related protein [Oceanimonas sp. CHS3-5]|uniref:pilus assembly protein TadG-related protein n=1 Tax=Oceanimonas sp. CHS3-5 TaxID=3068186 RepID=UPI00273DDC03|nr:pilus assembly protein TadG-related protein [Oceanimonas sp. CHS3-5]MDP5291067.1 pilus assembly protein TadG-related protein [Oceanimonas sp. CHS3-5]
MKALSHHRKQKGAILVLVTVALFVLLGFTALALDGGYLLLNKTRVQDAVDSAALSGAKTLSLSENNTHNDAIDAVETTLTRILAGEGFGQIDIDVDNLVSAVDIEFSLEPVPFAPSVSEDARYIRVSLNTVPVRQFFSQLLIDVWQVRASAVAGVSATIQDSCQIIPLMMCDSNPTPPADYNDIPDDYDFGFTPSTDSDRGDVLMIKSPTNNTPVGPGNFLAIDLPDANGADGFRDGLAGALTNASCIGAGESITTKTGNMSGPTDQGINTRFADYSGNMKNFEPLTKDEGGAYHPDCEVPAFSPVTITEDMFASSGGSSTLSNPASYALQSYQDYMADESNFDIAPEHPACITGRRIVRVPVGDCSNPIDKGNGKHEIPSVGTACMFLTQKVTDGPGNEKYIVAEFIDNCTADGGSYSNLLNGPDRLVLYKDTASGDS